MAVTRFTEVTTAIGLEVDDPSTARRLLLALHRPLVRAGARLTAAYVLTGVLLALMVVQSLLGLVVDGLYPEQAWAVAALRGNDLVTLVVAVPLLAGAAALTRWRPSTAAVVVWLAMLFYGVYNYAYYAFGAAFSDVFLLHVAALAVSAWALLMVGTSIDADVVAIGVRGGPWARVVAVFTTLVGLALVGAWGTMSVRFALTGALPEDVMPPAAVHLVYALDLAVLAPAFVVAGVLLWLRIPWGAVLAAAVNVSGAVYLAVLWVVGGFQADAGIPDRTWASPVAIGSVLLTLAAALVLLIPWTPSVRRASREPAATAARRAG
jgi:hypothetical protein